MEASASLKKAIVDYKKGDKEAFTTIYRESEKYLYSCIYKVAQGNDNAMDMTSDVMGDTYLEISQSISQLADEEKFLSWAGTIATRKCYAYLKKNKKYILLGEEDNTFEQLADDDNIIPEEVMQNRESQRLLREIIDNELNEMQKLCVIGYYYNEQKQSEIAEELGIPENTVKTHLSRAKAKIKAGVEELHIKKGTKLFSVAPLFLLLFKEDVQACEVPVQIGTKILGTVGASAGTIGAGASVASGASKGGIKGLIAKITGASTKAKLIGTAAAVGVAGAGTGAIVHQINRQEITWQEAYSDYLLETDEVDRFDLHDFDGDGSPELVASDAEGRFFLFTCKNGTFKNIVVWDVTNKKEIDADKYDTCKIYYGYGTTDGMITRFDDGDIKFEDGTSLRLQECWIYNYEDDITKPKLVYELFFPFKNNEVPFTADNYYYAVTEITDHEEKSSLNLDEGSEAVRREMAKFVAIDYTMLDDYTIEQSIEKTKEAAIYKRVTEYENMGNRPLRSFGLQF